MQSSAWENKDKLYHCSLKSNFNTTANTSPKPIIVLAEDLHPAGENKAPPTRQRERSRPPAPIGRINICGDLKSGDLVEDDQVIKEGRKEREKWEVKMVRLVALVACAISVNALNCVNIASTLQLQNAQVVLAQEYSPGQTFTEASAISGYNAPQMVQMDMCRVRVNVDTSASSSTQFEIFLPTQWNGRMLTVGNGGWNGGVNYPDIVTGANQGFASASTNGGHNGTSTDASFALNNPESLIDLGYRGLHMTVVVSKEIVQTYYNCSNTFKSYYLGCSSGGRQGLKEAQTSPDSFDGVVVGSPANYQSTLPASLVGDPLNLLPNTSSRWITPQLFEEVNKEVLRQCDYLDGAVDGVVSDPFRCNFRPESMLCNGTNAGNCLTPDQIVGLEGIYAPITIFPTKLVWPGLTPGGELNWKNGLITPQPIGIGTGFYKYMVTNNTNWNYLTDFNQSVVELGYQINPGNCDVRSPDFSAFKARNGKILHYVGNYDQNIATGNSIKWYNEVSRFYAGAVDDWYHLWTIAGMYHCEDGPGAWVCGGASQTSGGFPPPQDDAQHDLLLAMIDWVEKGIAPSTLIGTKYVNDTVNAGVAFQRPLCKYPAFLHYSGIGDVNSASSWSCQ